jgi:hypothetical protein
MHHFGSREPDGAPIPLDPICHAPLASGGLPSVSHWSALRGCLASGGLRDDLFNVKADCQSW